MTFTSSAVRRTLLRGGQIATLQAALLAMGAAQATVPAVPKSEINAAVGTGSKFEPPAESTIPDDQFGEMVRLGRKIMLDAPRYAKAYVGNSLSCVNCHADAGRMAGSVPLWAAFVSYPAYRGKNKKVNTYAKRLQGCFTYSENGKAPPLGSKVLVALESYSYWMAKGLPVDEKTAGRGYPDVREPAEAPDYVRGEQVYQARCAMCHRADDQGEDVAGEAVFPPLWGPKPFNWGAGMGSIKNAAKFIYANMPYGQSYCLTPQEAWDVAYFMDARERPQDPCWTGTVAGTRAKFRDSRFSLYGTKVNGKLLGDIGAPKPMR